MKIFKLVGFAFLGLAIISCNQKKYASKKLNTRIDSVSYAIGVDLAIKVKTNIGKINNDLFIQGYLNSLDSSGLLLKRQDLRIINTYIQEKRRAEIKKQREASLAAVEKKFASVKKQGEDFLAKNKTKKGVFTTKSGLQYQILKEGKGKKPIAESTVKVHYTGKLIDGTVFESSRTNNQPSTFQVKGVIKGWTEGLQLMKEGGKYRFFIPQELAYGPTYKSKLIQPFSALVFDIELLKIVKTK